MAPLKTLCRLPILGFVLAFAGASFGACADSPVPPEASPSPAPSAAPATPVPQASPPSQTPPPPVNSGQDPRNGPWNRDLVLYRSSDGKAFSHAGTFVERAGVPDVIRDSSGQLVAVFQWFPFDNRAAFDRVAVAFSSDNGATWTKPAQMTIAGLPETLMRPFDPTVAQLPDGRYRLYFTSNERGPQSRPAIYSAVSTDAVHYEFEPGVRFAPEGGTVDASIVFFQGNWHMLSHNQRANTGAGYHATSADGLSFSQLPDVNVGQGRQWIGNAVVVDGGLRYYGSGRDGVWAASSPDGAAWTIGPSPGLSLGDPSVVVLRSGELLLIAVGEPRADAGPAPD